MDVAGGYPVSRRCCAAARTGSSSRRPAARRWRPVCTAKPPKPDNGAAPAPAKASAPAATTTRVELEKIDRVVNMVGELVIAQAMLGPGGAVVAGGYQRPARAGPRRGRSSHPRAERQRDVDARPAGGRGVSAHAAAGARTGGKDRQESPPRNGRRKHRSRPFDHRAPGRSADPYHPQLDRSRHRDAANRVRPRASPKKAPSGFRPNIAAAGSSSRVSDDGAGINPERVLKKARERGLVERRRHRSPKTRSTI